MGLVSPVPSVQSDRSCRLGSGSVPTRFPHSRATVQALGASAESRVQLSTLGDPSLSVECGAIGVRAPATPRMSTEEALARVKDLKAKFASGLPPNMQTKASALFRFDDVR